MVAVHVTLGIAIIATNLIAGAWGGIAWLRDRPSVGFWYVLRVAQVAVVLQVGVGALLLLSGREGNGLHMLYGVLPLVISLLAEAARAGAAERELTGLDFESLPKDRQRHLSYCTVCVRGARRGAVEHHVRASCPQRL